MADNTAKKISDIFELPEFESKIKNFTFKMAK